MPNSVLPMAVSAEVIREQAAKADVALVTLVWQYFR